MKLQLRLLVVIFFFKLRLAHTQQIQTVLDEIDYSVQDIASQASANVEKICESLSQCTEQNCFRRPCMPLGKFEIRNLTCIAVDHNPDCSGSCGQSLLVSKEKSYIRLSPLASENNTDLQISMCAQQLVHAKLQQVWQSSTKSYQGRTFFGAAEGFLYTFPGRDYIDEVQCVKYDPRQRPWYINSLAVVKSVHILMDTSGSMANRVGPLSSESCLDVSQAIVSELLNTLTNEDRVALSDLSGVSIGSSVNVSLEGVNTSQEQAEIVALKDSLRKVKVQNQQTNFEAGLSEALSFFGARSSNDLKVLFIFSNGQFISSLNFTELAPVFKQLQEENVVAFVYQVGLGDSNNANSLQAFSTSLNTTLEVVKDGDNPLFKVRSYFDYLAWLRFQSVNKTSIWVPQYQDSSGLGIVTTSTYPAFDTNGRLIGVAGIDLIANRFIKELGSSVVQDAVSARSPSPSHQQTFIPPQMKPVSTPNCPQSLKLSPLCSRLDTTTPVRDFVCCSNCTGDSAEKSDSSWSTPTIAGVSVGGVLALATTAALSVWVYRRCTRTRTSRPDEKIQVPVGGWLMPNQTPSPQRAEDAK